jgi:hypothetical protein
VDRRLDDPAFWQRLYRRPEEDLNPDGEAGGRAVHFDEHDLVAELEPRAAGGGDEEQDALEALVTRLVQSRIAALLASGDLAVGPAPSAGAPAARPTSGSAPILRSAGSTEPTAPVPPAAPPRAAAPLAPPVAPRPSSPHSPEAGGAVARPVPGGGSAASAIAPPARPPGPSAAPPAASPPATGAYVGRRPPPSPEASGALYVGRRPPPSTPAIPTASAPPPARAPSADLGPLWERIPKLPGGPASLMSAQGLSQDATMLLVMIDGSTKLLGLRTLAPHVDDERFAAVIRDAMSRGLLVLE